MFSLTTASILLPLLLLLLNCFNNVFAINLNGICISPDRLTGTCIPINQCKNLFDILMKGSLSDDENEYLTKSVCGYRNQKPMVCCTSERPTISIQQRFNDHLNLLPDPGVCGTTNMDRIIGGNSTELNEYPWIALLEYSKPDDTKDFHCGGILINDRYVLTAAHCVQNRNIKEFEWKVQSVRLGEWNLETAEDCVDDDCSDPPIDVQIEEIIPHEMYTGSTALRDYDIALIRLANTIKYTHFIQPICLLKQSSLWTRVHDGITMEVAGWGRTEKSARSSIKLKVSVNGVSAQQCNMVYNRRRVTIGDNLLCAGGVRGRDSCSGDSGGPLMTIDRTNRLRPFYYCVGIVSFGPSSCGLEGWPSVYTRVSAFTQWIIDNIKP